MFDRQTTHKQALLLGYYLKQELNIEPTTDNIEKIINEHPNLDELIATLERNIDPTQRTRFDQELTDLNEQHENGEK